MTAARPRRRLTPERSQQILQAMQDSKNQASYQQEQEATEARSRAQASAQAAAPPAKPRTPGRGGKFLLTSGVAAGTCAIVLAGWLTLASTFGGNEPENYAAIADNPYYAAATAPPQAPAAELCRYGEEWAACAAPTPETTAPRYSEPEMGNLTIHPEVWNEGIITGEYQAESRAHSPAPDNEPKPTQAEPETPAEAAQALTSLAQAETEDPAALETAAEAAPEAAAETTPVELPSNEGTTPETTPEWNPETDASIDVTLVTEVPAEWQEPFTVAGTAEETDSYAPTSAVSQPAYLAYLDPTMIEEIFGNPEKRDGGEEPLCTKAQPEHVETLVTSKSEVETIVTGFHCNHSRYLQLGNAIAQLESMLGRAYPLSKTVLLNTPAEGHDTCGFLPHPDYNVYSGNVVWDKSTIVVHTTRHGADTSCGRMEATIIHEVAHAWFHGNELWFDEGMADHLERKLTETRARPVCTQFKNLKELERALDDGEETSNCEYSMGGALFDELEMHFRSKRGANFYTLMGELARQTVESSNHGWLDYRKGKANLWMADGMDSKAREIIDRWWDGDPYKPR